MKKKRSDWVSKIAPGRALGRADICALTGYSINSWDSVRRHLKGVERCSGITLLRRERGRPWVHIQDYLEALRTYLI